jgi:hypothetical protein
MLSNPTSLQRIHNKDILLMLIEMTPIYWKFRMVPCDFLLNEAPSERFEELNYEDKPKNTPDLDDISLSLQQKICEHANLL